MNKIPQNSKKTVPILWQVGGLVYRYQPLIYFGIALYALYSHDQFQLFHDSYIPWFVAVGFGLLFLLWIEDFNIKYYNATAMLFGIDAKATITNVKALGSSYQSLGVRRFMVHYDIEVKPDGLPSYKATSVKRMPYYAVKHFQPGMDVSVRYLPNKKEKVVITEDTSDETLLKNKG